MGHGEGPLDERGRALLAELTADPDSDCWRQFDALFYEAVWKYLRANHARLSSRVARYLGLEGDVAPLVRPEEVSEVAHDATTIALRRVRQNAARFDPARGTPTMWVIGAAEYAYIEVAKATVGARRSERLAFVDPHELPEEPDGMTPEAYLLRRLDDQEALREAAGHVSEKEFIAIRLVLTAGYSYAEAAEVLFGNATMTKQVDGLLTRGKRKLAEAWQEHESSSSTTMVPSAPDRRDE